MALEKAKDPENTDLIKMFLLTQEREAKVWAAAFIRFISHFLEVILYQRSGVAERKTLGHNAGF